MNKSSLLKKWTSEECLRDETSSREYREENVVEIIGWKNIGEERRKDEQNERRMNGLDNETNRTLSRLGILMVIGMQ